MSERENLSSRLGFLLISAGCAIGLGNVWRFPYVTGKYGGGAFVVLYLIFLVLLGLPIMVMELSVGRASRKSAAASFRALEPKGTKWHVFSVFAVIGNYLLMMFYTTIAGWILCYILKMATGVFEGKNTPQIEGIFEGMLAAPGTMVFFMALVVLIGFGVCAIGLQKGVEKLTKIMMGVLFLILIVLAVRAVTLPGAAEGLSFYLLPNFEHIMDNLPETIFAAMGQAFFTLSIGIGSIAIFGSLIDRTHRLTSEAIHITVLDTVVAVIAGLIIFPACFSFGVSPDSGPRLVFVTLPGIFNSMPGGRVWGTLFFIFMAFAALTTVIAVFENIISFGVDLFHWSRKKSIAINIVLVFLLSLPCVFGFNLLSGVQPFGLGSTIQDLEDFIVSNNLLPLGSLVYLMFCTRRYGWGYENFIEEANAGKGLKFPRFMRGYVKYVLPLIIIVIFIQGYIVKFF